jgi:HTH-type transcriptional regulator, sugar sensing transcriptional regulator
MSIPRSSLYGFLYNLAASGLVVQTKVHDTKMWQAVSPEKISAVFDKKMSDFEIAKSQFEKILATLKNKYSKDIITPRFLYFEGVEGLKNIFRDGLMYRDIATQSFWPIKDMLDSLGPEFFIGFNKKRIQRGIRLQIIWPENERVSFERYPFLGVGKKHLRDIRISPKGISCTMGYWAYENKVAFISSKKESFGFIVESRELRQMMKTQFDILWKMSKAV